MEKRCIARAVFILWMLHSLIPFSLEDDEFSLLYDTCSARKFCKANATKFNDEVNTTSCCQDCSCKPTCTLAGNCCPDFEFENGTNDLPQTACTKVKELLNGGRFGSNYKFGQIAYNFIGFCPQDTKRSYNTVSDCLYPRVLEDYIPVSSSNGELLFKNKHCAHCHNFTDIVPWNLILDDGCLDIATMNFKSSLEMDEYILSTCFLDARPSNPIYAKKVACFSETDVNRCNTSGDWAVYDSDIESKCHANDVHMHTQFYEMKNRQITLRYANVYCFYCNSQLAYKQLEPNSMDICPVPDYYEDRKDIGLKPAFSFLFKAQQRNEKQPEKSDPCLETEAYDPHYKICRQVLCRWGYFPSNGQCAPIGKFEAIYFLVVFTGDLSSNLHDRAMEIGLAFANKLSTGILPGCEAKFCLPSIFMLFDRISLFTTAFLPTETCDFGRLLDALHDLRGGELTLEVNDTTRQDFSNNVTLKIVTENVNVDYKDHYHSFGNTVCGHTITLELDMLDRCPKIQLPFSDLNLFDEGTADVLIANQISEKYDDDGEHIIILCVSDYLDITHGYLNSASQGGISAGLLFFALTTNVLLYQMS